MIDLLLPFYGDPALMRLTVASVLAQRDDRWRLVVVDDGYPDPQVSDWFARLDHPRVEYHRNARNLGANANYRHALEYATAEHLCVLGADDLLLPDFVGVVLRALEHAPEADVVQCGVTVVDGAGRATSSLVDRTKSLLRPRADTVRLLSGGRLLTSLLTGNWTYFPSLVWRTDTIRRIGFRPDFHVVQDLALLVDVVSAGGTMALVSDVAFCYRRHAGSDSAVKTVDGERFAEERAWFDVAARDLRAAGERRAAWAARIHLTSRLHAAALLPGTMRRRNLPATRRLLHHALR